MVVKDPRIPGPTRIFDFVFNEDCYKIPLSRNLVLLLGLTIFLQVRPQGI